VLPDVVDIIVAICFLAACAPPDPIRITSGGGTSGRVADL